MKSALPVLVPEGFLHARNCICILPIFGVDQHRILTTEGEHGRARTRRTACRESQVSFRAAFLCVGGKLMPSAATRDDRGVVEYVS